jgi:hypothetical protein
MFVLFGVLVIRHLHQNDYFRWTDRPIRRYYADFHIDLPHESFARAVAADPDEFSVQKFDSCTFPPSYLEHAVVKAKGDLAVPVGYFSDGVPHTKKDTFIAHYWSNTLTGRRYMICSLRKSDLCRCGCKGFCTMGRLQRIIAWSFNALADGRYPRFDYDGKPFADELRSSTKKQLAGSCNTCRVFVGFCFYVFVVALVPSPLIKPAALGPLSLPINRKVTHLPMKAKPFEE